MLNKAEIEEIIYVFEKANLNKFKIKKRDIELEMRKNCNGSDNSYGNNFKNKLNKMSYNASSNQTRESKEENFQIVKSPIVGTFYTSATPEDKNFVEIGDSVKEDTIVCVIEAMKLYNEVEAGFKGKIIEKIVGNGEMVEYGQPLFKIETD